MFRKSTDHTKSTGMVTKERILAKITRIENTSGKNVLQMRHFNVRHICQLKGESHHLLEPP